MVLGILQSNGNSCVTGKILQLCVYVCRFNLTHGAINFIFLFKAGCVFSNMAREILAFLDWILLSATLRSHAGVHSDASFEGASFFLINNQGYFTLLQNFFMKHFGNKIENIIHEFPICQRTNRYTTFPAKIPSLLLCVQMQ
jgi:hypothetical protein